MHPVPAALSHRPFTTAEAAALGLSWRTLQGRRFRRVLPGVYVAATVPLTHEVGLRAASLLLPDDAVVSGVSAAGSTASTRAAPTTSTSRRGRTSGRGCPASGCTDTAARSTTSGTTDCA